MLMYAKEFKKLFRKELEMFNFYPRYDKFLLDIGIFEDKYGEIDTLSIERQELMYKIAEKY